MANTATVTITGTASAPYLLQRSIDGGTTWAPVRATAGAAVGFTGAIGGGGSATYVDTEPFAAAAGGGLLPGTLDYQAAIGDSTGTKVSAFSTVASVAPTVEHWSLAQTQPGGTNVLMIVTDHQQTQAHRATLHQVLGNPDPVVIYDVTDAFTGTFKVWTGTQAAYAAVLAMVAEDQVLFLVSPYGDVLYVQIQPTGESTTITPTSAASPYRVTTVEYTQVAEPL